MAADITVYNRDSIMSLVIALCLYLTNLNSFSGGATSSAWLLVTIFNSSSMSPRVGGSQIRVGPLGSQILVGCNHCSQEREVL